MRRFQRAAKSCTDETATRSSPALANVLQRVDRATSTTYHGVSRKVGVKSPAMPPSSQPAKSAKQFLISKVLRQAVSDGVMLSDLEERMLNFSEGAASAADIEAVANFDSEYDSDAYEAKIAWLLRRAYQHDAKLGQTHQWQDALSALRSEDWYILVMLQQAGIKRGVGWDITVLCICAGIETLIGLSYARGVIGLRWALIGLAVFGFGIVRQIVRIKASRHSWSRGLSSPLGE